MLDKFANIFRIPDLRKRVFFTLALLAVYRVGGHIPIPGVNWVAFANNFGQFQGGLLGFVSAFRFEAALLLAGGLMGWGTTIARCSAFAA